VRLLLAAGDRNPSAGPGRHRHARHDQAVRRNPQVTYDSHPLYTYVGDTAPGQDFGNGINLNGGLWDQVIVSG
jgi:predicted lipoprotein with Yx(FWY)xxD motif